MADTKITRSGPTNQAYGLLKIGFIVAPLIAGLDKFFYFLTDWTQYLAPIFPSMLGVEATTFMLFVGVIEIIAAIGVAVKPKVFGSIVGLWLLGIVTNLLILGAYYDIALRDIGLSIGAFALARLAVLYEKPSEAKDRGEKESASTRERRRIRSGRLSGAEV